MGRLQRKKVTPKKKRTKSEEDAGISNGNGSEKKPSLFSAGTSEKKKKPPQLQKKSGAEDAVKQDGFVNKGLQFLREVKIELKKVTWPTRTQTIGSTVVVIILVMIISFFLGLVDIGLSSLVQLVLH